MAGVTFGIAVDDAKALAGLAAVDAGLSDMSDLMDGIGRMMVASAIERISTTNIGPDGIPWEPSNRVREHGGRTLYLSGQLRTSIAAQVGPDHVLVGSNMPYAGVMHEGAEQGEFGAAIGRTRPTEKRPKSQDYFTPLPWGDIPGRPYLGISDDEQPIIGDLAQAYFAGLIGGVR